jgi:hypothetical protein
MENASRKLPVKWPALSSEEEKMILRDYDRGTLRSEIMRKYNISSDQFGYIVRMKGSVVATTLLMNAK